MSNGNGVDLGSIYNLLLQVANTVSRHDAVLERHGQVLEVLVREVQEVRAILPTLATKQELSAAVGSIRAEMADLRQAVTHYHSSVIGHGILISELEVRMRRVEDHLNLSAA